MTKQFIAIALLGITSFWGRNALAAPDPPSSATYSDVRYTVHNLSNSTTEIGGGERSIYARSFENPDFSDSISQVCVFCHTPHSATTAVPLWNKAYKRADLENSGDSDPHIPNPSAYRLYTSSATLSRKAKQAQITIDSPSMLCLSCHDGKTAFNVLHYIRDNGGYLVSDYPVLISGGASDDSPSGQAYLSYFGRMGGAYPADIGAARDVNGLIPGDNGVSAAYGLNLADDHPIGFSYSQARDELGNDKLNDLQSAKDKGLRFYGPNRDRMECSTCHNPHVYYGYGRGGAGSVKLAAVSTPEQRAKKPFLVRDNNGSALCIACHNK